MDQAEAACIHPHGDKALSLFLPTYCYIESPFFTSSSSELEQAISTIFLNGFTFIIWGKTHTHASSCNRSTAEHATNPGVDMGDSRGNVMRIASTLNTKDKVMTTRETPLFLVDIIPTVAYQHQDVCAGEEGTPGLRVRTPSFTPLLSNFFVSSCTSFLIR